MNSVNKTIEVACAIVSHGGKYLITQRGPQMKMPFFWEFPGGKIEHGETPESCIVREIREELSIEINILDRLPACLYHYPEVSISLIPFIAEVRSGKIQLTEHQSFKWVFWEELNLQDMAPADVLVVEKLGQYLEKS